MEEILHFYNNHQWQHEQCCNTFSSNQRVTSIHVPCGTEYSLPAIIVFLLERTPSASILCSIFYTPSSNINAFGAEMPHPSLLNEDAHFWSVLFDILLLVTDAVKFRCLDMVLCKGGLKLERTKASSGNIVFSERTF